MSLLTDGNTQPPAAKKDQLVPDGIRRAGRCGYRHGLVIEMFQSYYEVLGPRAEALLDHDDAAVRELAAATVAEVEIFDLTEGSYGDEFFLLQRR